MLQALVVSNAIVGLEAMFPSSERVRYRFAVTGPDFELDLAGIDLLIVPNGSDHVALYRNRAHVSAFLERGKTLFCFDGWFTGWVPGHRWVHDNGKPTRAVRYSIGTDRHGLFRGVDLDHFQYYHGISGWWACGYIEAAPGAEVLLHDTWGRPVLVLDECTTPGRMCLSASGPLGEVVGHETIPNGLMGFYQNLLAYVLATHSTPAHVPA